MQTAVPMNDIPRAEDIADFGAWPDAAGHFGRYGGVFAMGALSALIVGPCVAAPLAGALHLPDDETGNCAFFAHQLKDIAARDGVRFRFGETVQGFGLALGFGFNAARLKQPALLGCQRQGIASSVQRIDALEQPGMHEHRAPARNVEPRQALLVGCGNLGRDRHALIMSGAAILQAMMRIWPTDRLSVADRGLREGLLYAQMSADGVLADGPYT